MVQNSQDGKYSTKVVFFTAQSLASAARQKWICAFISPLIFCITLKIFNLLSLECTDLSNVVSKYCPWQDVLRTQGIWHVESALYTVVKNTKCKREGIWGYMYM